MLIGNDLPELGTDLVAALATLDMHDFSHGAGGGNSVSKSLENLQNSRNVLSPPQEFRLCLQLGYAVRRWPLFSRLNKKKSGDRLSWKATKEACSLIQGTPTAACLNRCGTCCQLANLCVGLVGPHLRLS